MKIMVIADVESKALWDYFDKSKIEGVELIISAGDLNPQYLSFLATFSKAPILYIHGNHDGCYIDNPPEGCTCIDGEVYEYKGIRIMGLGGSMKYKNGPFMYSEFGMQARLAAMGPKIRKKKGIDILVCHSPIAGFHDMDDLPHKGYECLGSFIKKNKPDIFVHGHVHLSYGRFPRESEYEGTRVINAYEKYIFEYEPEKRY